MVLMKTKPRAAGIENNHHNQKSHWCHCGDCFVRKVVCQVGLCGSTGIGDDLADLSAAFGFYVAKVQGHNVFHHNGPHGSLHVEGGNMGAYQSHDVQKHAKEGKAYCVPAIGGDSLSLGKIKLHAKHFLHDPPDVIKWHKCDQSTDPGKNHGKNA